METVILNLEIPVKMVLPIIPVPGQNVQDAIRETGIWSREETDILINILKNNPHGTVIDVGCNTGYFSLISLSYHHPTIAIEANPIHKQFLIESVKTNEIDSNLLQYHQGFASCRNEDVNFDGWTGNPEIINENLIYKVKTVQIDKLCKKALFLKIDVEGCEPEVFKSAFYLISNHQVPYIVFELTYIINDKVDKEQINLLQFLYNNDYHLYEIGSEKLHPIKNIDHCLSVWSHDFYTKYKRDGVTCGGCNILAVLEGNIVPYTICDTTHTTNTDEIESI